MTAPESDRLGIYRAADCWMVSYARSTQRDHILGLFGTTELPLPFTPAADEQTVRDTLSKQQPGTEIYRLPDQGGR